MLNRPRPLSARPAKAHGKATTTQACKPDSAPKSAPRPTSAPPKRSQPSAPPAKKPPVPEFSTKRGTASTRTATTKPKTSSKTRTTSIQQYDPLLNAQSDLDVPLLLIRKRVELALQGNGGDALAPQVNTRYEQARSRYVRAKEPSDDGANGIKPLSHEAREPKYPIVEVVGAVGWGADSGGGINTMDWCTESSLPVETASLSNPLEVFDESMKILESRLNHQLAQPVSQATSTQNPNSQGLDQPGGCLVEEVGAGIWEVCSSDRSRLMTALFSGD
eukprot:1176366-Prorocentrum_minimum.AAC.1